MLRVAIKMANMETRAIDILVKQHGTIARIGERLGLHRSAVYKWFKGGRVPPSRIDALVRISEGRLTRERIEADNERPRRNVRLIDLVRLEHD